MIIELLLAVAIFSFVTTIAVGGFVRALRTERQAAAFLAANSNVSQVLEQMAREMRTGYDFCEGGPCNEGAVSFTNANDQSITYRANTGGAGYISRQCIGATCPSAGQERLTASKVDIRDARFTTQFDAVGDGYPPVVTIFVSVAPVEAESSGFIVNLQTSISVRQVLDS